jgi:predicted MPP superfamily phosphohydrolase
MPLSRRKFIELSVGALATGILGMSLYEPHETVISQVLITLKRLPSGFDGIRIAQLSDIHFNSFMTISHLDRVIELTNAQKPDLVILTGDFVTAAPHKRERIARAEQAWPCASVLRRIESPLGCFAVLGNHDYDTKADVVAEALSAGSRIQVLRNRAIAFERDGARLWLAGIDNVTKARARPDDALRGVPTQECTVVAVHEPDFADEMLKYPVDFQMSGHSHGGQVRFPGVGALYLPPWARKYPMGHYQIGELQLYTNRGIGVLGLPMRFMCPPEITVFTLKKESATHSPVSKQSG